MFQEGLPLQPFNRPGTVALRWFAVVWLGVALPTAFSQEPPAAAPLPRNLAPNESIDGQVATVPSSVVQPAVELSCEPSFQTGAVDNCNDCLELWQGYCQEPHGFHHGISPRHHLLGCWQFCCSRLAWWRGLGIPISLPRMVDTSRAVCCSEANRNSCAEGTSDRHGENCAGDRSPVTNTPAPAPEPHQPIAPPEPSGLENTPENKLPLDPDSEQSSAAAKSSAVAANEAPEPRLQVKSVSWSGKSGTMRFVQALQQAAF